MARKRRIVAEEVSEESSFVASGDEILKISPRKSRISPRKEKVESLTKVLPAFTYLESGEFKLDKEFEEMNGLLKTSMDMVSECGIDLSEAGEYEESQNVMDVLKDVLRLEEAVNRKRRILSDLEKSVRFADGPNDSASLVESFQSLAEKDFVEEAGVIDWRKVSKIREYNELTWEIGPGFGNRQAYPPIKMDSSEEPDEEELVMQSRDSLICPISQATLVEPVQNTSCKHIYSKANIERLIALSSAISCPVSGCRGVVQKKTLLPSEEMEKKLRIIVEKRIFK